VDSLFDLWGKLSIAVGAAVPAEAEMSEATRSGVFMRFAADASPVWRGMYAAPDMLLDVGAPADKRAMWQDGVLIQPALWHYRLGSLRLPTPSKLK
jgi:hypothetical protein